MKSQFGLQVDAWGALVLGRAKLADVLEELVIKNVEERGIENLTVDKKKVNLDRVLQEHIVFERDLGRGGRATAALRIAQQGTDDLVISWRLFEKNVNKDRLWGCAQGGLIFVGSIVTLIGLILAIVGVGFCIFPVGLAMLGAAFAWWQIGKSKTTASTTEQLESRVLARTVDWALLRALAAQDVGDHEFRILQQASTSGLGNLETTRLSDYIEPNF